MLLYASLSKNNLLIFVKARWLVTYHYNTSGTISYCFKCRLVETLMIKLLHSTAMTTTVKLVSLIVCLCAAWTLVASRIVCTKDSCERVHCPELPASCSGPDHALGRGGFCNCCQVCFTLLGE